VEHGGESEYRNEDRGEADEDSHGLKLTFQTDDQDRLTSFQR
jgi:hypothetical protein